jgi:hypothetical protein
VVEGVHRFGGCFSSHGGMVWVAVGIIIIAVGGSNSDEESMIPRRSRNSYPILKLSCASQQARCGRNVSDCGGWNGGFRKTLSIGVSPLHFDRF